MRSSPSVLTENKVREERLQLAVRDIYEVEAVGEAAAAPSAYL